MKFLLAGQKKSGIHLLFLLLFIILSACTWQDQAGEEVPLTPIPTLPSTSPTTEPPAETVNEINENTITHSDTSPPLFVEEIVSPNQFTFEFVNAFTDQGFASVGSDGKWGIINTQGQLILPVEYEYIHGDFYEGFFDDCVRIMQNHRYGFANKNGNIVIPLEYEWATHFSNGFATVVKDNKFGIIDTKGELVIPFMYDYMNIFLDNRVLVYTAGKSGVIDINGNEIIPQVHDSLYPLVFDDHTYLFVLGQDAVYAMADAETNLLTDYEYEYISEPHEGYAVMRKTTSKWGYLDANGKEVIPAEYDMVFNFHHGLASVQKNGFQYFIDKTGEVVFEGSGLSFSKNFDVTEQADDDGNWGVINRSGEIVVPIRYYNTYIYNEEGLIYVSEQTDEGWANGYYDMTGKIIVPVKVRNETGTGSGPSEGFISLFTDSKWGFIDHNGNTVIDFAYESVGSFKNGLAPVMLDGLWGYIDKTGQVIVPLQYDEAQEFSNGYAWVRKEDKWGIIQVKERSL